ncbi:MAG: YitT family protein [Oscillospiraceae bacterium]|nr:YitT family protein [Oscillospiraceae bacterium]
MLLDNLMWFLGSAIYSAAINIFAIPNRIALSGVSGLSIVVNYLFSLPVGVTNFVLNLPLIVLAWIFIGRKFVLKTLWVISVMSVAIDLLVPFLSKHAYTGDRLLAAVFCGIMMGAGLSLVLLRGATTGGTDIVGSLVRTRWPHVTMGRVILIADVIIIVISAAAFRSVESGMYAAIVILLSTRVVDYALYGMDNGKLLLIVTEKAEEMSKELTANYPRGVTLLPAKGGYTGEDKGMLVMAVRKSEVARVNKIVRELDDKTFTIITEAGEILGNGFKLES